MNFENFIIGWTFFFPGLLFLCKGKKKKTDSKTVYYVVVQPPSPVRLFVTPWTIAHQVPLTSAISRSLLKFTSTGSVILSNSSSSATPFSCPQPFPASGSFLMSWLFTSSGQSIGALASSSSPFNEYSGLISLRIDWFDLLAVQRTLRHHNSKASVPQCSAYYYGPTLTFIHDYVEKP